MTAISACPTLTALLKWSRYLYLAEALLSTLIPHFKIIFQTKVEMPGNKFSNL
jgi:hypothetical protein